MLFLFLLFLPIHGLVEIAKTKIAYAIKFYETLSQFDVVSSTPTLFNSGTTHSQLSSCYLNTFDDSIDGIFDGIWHAKCHQIFHQ